MKTSQYRARKARTWSYCQSTASHKNVETIFPKNPVVLVWQRVCASAEEFLRKGCHCQGKVREKRKFFKVREKSGEIFDIVKVSERSENSFFQFIVHKFSSRLWNAFSFGKDEKHAAKQGKRSIWHSTPDLCSSCGQWFSLWMISSKFLLPLSAKSGKRLKRKRKMSMACKKTKANVNIDCFSLIKGQWKNCLKFSEESSPTNTHTFHFVK